MDPLLVDVCVAEKGLCLTPLILTVKGMSNPLISGERCLGDFTVLTGVNMEGCVRIQIYTNSSSPNRQFSNRVDRVVVNN